jgi:hypothetical protein
MPCKAVRLWAKPVDIPATNLAAIGARHPDDYMRPAFWLPITNVG